MSPDISISENYISDDNLYLAGLKTWFNATYERDVVSVALDQVIQGTIFGDVTLLGNKISLRGEMFDDVRIVGNEVRIIGVTNKDLVIVANRVIIERDAIVNGDTLILANSVEAQGQFLGEAQMTANKIAVTGSLIGPTTLTSQRLVFGSSAKVVADVAYFSPQRATVESGAEIQKPLNFNQIESIKQNDVVKKIFFGFVSFWSIIKLIATLFVLFIMTHMFRVFSQDVAEIVAQRKWATILTGVVSLIVVPIVILILFASLVLIPVSIMLALIFLMLIILLPAMSAIILGYLYQLCFRRDQKVVVEFNVSALFLIFLTFLGFVPYVGSTTIYLVYTATFGAMVTYLYGQIRRKKIKL
jgi:cytoskeletal protein CcmA (bactofilin family)